MCKKLLIILSILILAACVAEPVVKRASPDIHQQQTDRIHTAVKPLLQQGDWIVTRGYHATDTLVVNATGMPISHVGVYDSENNTVIEAEGKGIHTTSLIDFIDKSHRILIIRPRWSTPERSEIAVAKARALVGQNYDFLGTIGINSSNRFYCSELAVDIYKDWRDPSEKIPAVIKPGELYLWGSMLYDSKPRNECCDPHRITR